MKEKVLATIQKYSMLAPGDRVLVAVSGGPDSVALLHVLFDLRETLDLELHVFHLNHMMRGKASERDALFVKELADELGLPCTIRSFDVPAYIDERGLSPEEGAREVRYMLLDEVAEEVGASKIALGHQANDQVETFIMRILRGAGMEGLGGIPPVRNRYIRPLIEVGREEIEAYCREERIEFRVDASNLNLSYLRNRVRHRLIPALQEYSPGFRENALKTIEILAADQVFLEEVTEEEFTRIAVTEEKLVKLTRSALLKLPLAIRRRVIREGIRFVKGDLTGIEFKHIEAISDYVTLGKGKLQVDLPHGLVAFSEYGAIIVAQKKKLKSPAVGGVLLDIPGATEVRELGVKFIADLGSARDFKPSEEKEVAYLDADELRAPLQGRRPPRVETLKIRTRLPGDSFRPLGMKGSRKLQDFFVDEKVPRRRRDRVPILEMNGQIVWVVGYRIDDRFKVTDETRKVLRLKVENLKPKIVGKNHYGE